jgi:hypothetical protein
MTAHAADFLVFDTASGAIPEREKIFIEKHSKLNVYARA